MQRLDYIKERLSVFEKMNFYKGKEVVKEMIEFYTKRLEQLENVSHVDFETYDFLHEAIKKSEGKEKLSKFDAIYKRILRLETHKYAPELNAIQFTQKGTPIAFKVPHCVKIEDALTILFDKLAVSELNNIIKTCKVIR